jgi:hypothetical protein
VSKTSNQPFQDYVKQFMKEEGKAEADEDAGDAIPSKTTM